MLLWLEWASMLPDFSSSGWIHSLLSEPVRWSNRIANFLGSPPQMGLR